MAKVMVVRAMSEIYPVMNNTKWAAFQTIIGVNPNDDLAACAFGHPLEAAN